MCSHYEGALILTVPKTPLAPYSISFPTLRREKEDGASQLARVCRCARRHTKIFDQRDIAVTISRCKWRNNPLFDTPIGATLTAFVANNANCEYGHVRTNSSGRRDTLYLSSLLSNCNNCIFQPAPQVPVEKGSHEGSPKFVIPCEQLEYLLSYDISATDISKALGVSRSTIYRRLRE